MSLARPCEACGDPKTTRHHVYPRYLRDIWRPKVRQKIAFLCRLCHDVVHTPYTTRDIIRQLKRDPLNQRWAEYHWRFRSIEVQACLSVYRRILRALIRDGIVLRVEEEIYSVTNGIADFGDEYFA
jgi:hypothetical protein